MSAGAPDGVYKSVDGGASWKLASFGGDVPERLVADPDHPGVVYLDNRNDSSFQKTIDGGASWTEFAWDIGCRQIAVDPVTIDTLYCAAFHASSGLSAGVYKSTNAGATWGPANNGLPPGVNGTLLLATPNAVFVAVDDALYRSLDAGASWTTASPARVYAIAYAPAMPNRIYLSNDGGISISNDNGASFGAPVYPGDFVGGLAVDPTNPDLVYGAGASGVVTSSNGGVSWKLSSNGLDAHWISSVAIAAGTSNTVLDDDRGGGAPVGQRRHELDHCARVRGERLVRSGRDHASVPVRLSLFRHVERQRRELPQQHGHRLRQSLRPAGDRGHHVLRRRRRSAVEIARQRRALGRRRFRYGLEFL